MLTKDIGSMKKDLKDLAAMKADLSLMKTDLAAIKADLTHVKCTTDNLACQSDQFPPSEVRCYSFVLAAHALQDPKTAGLTATWKKIGLDTLCSAEAAKQDLAAVTQWLVANEWTEHNIHLIGAHVTIAQQHPDLWRLLKRFPPRTREAWDKLCQLSKE